MTGTITDPETERAIADARAKLQRFERSATTSELLTRLRASSRLHPFLLMRSLGGLAAAFSFALALVVMLVPLLSRDLASQLALLDDASGLPLPIVLGVLGGLSLVVALFAQFAATSSARSAPLLPHEAKIHQRLVSELQQLEAQRAVKERMTPKPAQPRLLARG